MTNPRTKGASGEREIADDLNFIVYQVMQKLGMEPVLDSIQRNQNQSAVGGSDLVNTFGLAIEIKRQESLAINTWWEQTKSAALRNNHIPVLLYRQNRKPWQCVLNGFIKLPTYHVFGPANAIQEYIDTRIQIDYEAFKRWFEHWVTIHLKNGHKVIR